MSICDECDMEAWAEMFKKKEPQRKFCGSFFAFYCTAIAGYGILN